LVDMAVPRDVDPAVARLDSVFLYSLDSLQTIVDQNLARRRREAPHVEEIVEQEVERFFQWTRSLEVTPIVRELRERFETVRTEEIRRHLHLFPHVDRASLEALTKGLVNKLLHRPTTRIKALNLDSEEGLIRLDAVRELFDLQGSDGSAGAVSRSLDGKGQELGAGQDHNGKDDDVRTGGDGDGFGS
ncbi:MAG: glutamyl-tRNA reductase, partial [Thermoplasmata archaeon]